jgi:transcriptional regulator GlxA family with amidase domain
MHKRSVAILIFPDVELLDFAGPFEVFSSARMTPDPAAERLMNVWAVAESRDPLRCANPLTVVADYTLEECPPCDILLVPGGFGARAAATRSALVEWIRERAASAELTTSVCTGSFLLGAAGLLDSKQATTHWGSIERMRTTYPAITVLEEQRWVDEGSIISSSGVSAGIDMALYIVARLYGPEAAAATARWIEYEHWRLP